MHSKRLQLFNYNRSGVDSASSFVNSERCAAIGVPSLLAFVLFVVSVPKFDITAVVAYSAFPLFAAILLNISYVTLFKRLLILSPFILIMAAANPLLDRQPFITVGAVTFSAGIISGIVIVVKSVVAIGAVIIFSYCVHFTSFCKVLRTIRVPEVFVTQLLLLYRYSFLLVDEAQAMQRARSMRSFRKNGTGIVTTAKLIGSLLLRTASHADHIYRAMVARGFSGEFDRRNKISFKLTDWCAIVIIVSVFVLIRIIF